MLAFSLCLLVASSESMEGFLVEFAEKRERLVVLEAAFEQRNATVDEEEVSEGTLVYANPRRIVFRYASPTEAVVLIDGLKVYEYDVEFEQVQIFSLEADAETEALYLGFESDVGRLTEAYDLEFFKPGDAYPETTKGLMLHPKAREDDAAPLFERVHLYLRESDYLPIRIYIVNDAESSVDISISDIVVNKTIDPVRTQLNVPEGVRIIEDELDKGQVGPEGKLMPEPIEVMPRNSEPDPAEESETP